MSKDVKCVIGSRYCAGQNVRLSRNMKLKRVSHIENDGKVTGSMRSVTNLSSCEFQCVQA